MVRYTAEQKTNALELMDKIGVKKACENLGISIQTLYKWRSETQPKVESAPKEKKKRAASTPPQPRKKASESVQALLEEDDALLTKVKRLEAENTALIAMNLKLKKALRSFIEE